MPFHQTPFQRGPECESTKSRDTWSNFKASLALEYKAGQRLTEFCQENALIIANTLFQQRRDHSTHGHHQMVNIEIRLVIFFASEDGEALYSQQKQDQELSVAQIMNSLLPNSD